MYKAKGASKLTSNNKYTGMMPSDKDNKAPARLDSRSPKKSFLRSNPSKQTSKALWGNSERVKSAVQKTKRAIADKKKTAALVGGLLFITLIGGVYLTGQRNEEQPLDIKPETVAEELPKEKPAFDLAYPAGRQEEAYDVVRISPDEAEPSYVYLDRFTAEGVIFRVTQQKVPANFSLAKTAEDFQATNVIQVDDTTVYHGYSEKGGVQSLLFEKNDLLILIRSPERFTDDTWASYIAAMQ